MGDSFLRREGKRLSLGPRLDYTKIAMSSNANFSPFLRSDEPVNIAALFSADGVTPVKCTLDGHLRNLYRALFAFSGTNAISLQTIKINYSTKIGEFFDETIPILFIPYLTACTNATGPGIYFKELCKQQADACEASFASQMLPSDQGRFVFAFTLMSGTNENDLALLEANNLYLSLTDISAAT